KTTEIRHGEKLPSNLADLARTKPLLYALMEAQFGHNKLRVPLPTHRDIRPRNAANLQQKHYDKHLQALYPPLPPDQVSYLEEIARTGRIPPPNDKELTEAERQAFQEWVDHWVRLPPERQIRRYYRALLDQVPIMTKVAVQVKRPGSPGEGDAEPQAISFKIAVAKSPWSGGSPLPPVR
ncbi:hypothetical protein EV182_008136, partial [Spiromyces aspiralis]